MRQHREIDGAESRALGMDVAVTDMDALGQQTLRHTRRLQDVKAVRANADRLRQRRRAFVLVYNAWKHAAPGQLNRGGQACRPGADDENSWINSHTTCRVALGVKYPGSPIFGFIELLLRLAPSLRARVSHRRSRPYPTWTTSAAPMFARFVPWLRTEGPL